MSIEIKVDSKEVFSGRLLHVTSDSVLLENGKQAVREIIHHNGAAAVIAFDENNRLLMVRQYRYAIGQELLEIPAGKIDPGETPRIEFEDNHTAVIIKYPKNYSAEDNFFSQLCQGAAGAYHHHALRPLCGAGQVRA